MSLRQSLTLLRTLSASPVSSAPLPNITRSDLERAILSKARRLHALALGSLAAAVSSVVYAWPSIKDWSYNESRELAEMAVGHPFLQSAAAALGRKLATDAILSADPYTTSRLRELLGDVVDNAREEEEEKKRWTSTLAEKMARSERLRNGALDFAGDVVTRPAVRNAVASLGREVSCRQSVLKSCKDYVSNASQGKDEKRACAEYVRKVVHDGWYSDSTYQATRDGIASILNDADFRASAKCAIWRSATEIISRVSKPKLAKRTTRQFETL